MKVVCDINDPSPIAFQDVYEEGDEWIKIQGCEVCPVENRRQCCNDCHHLTLDAWCDYQVKNNESGKIRSSNKPWKCVIKPYPSSAMSFCTLQFKCIKGSNIGKIRRVCDPGGVFIDG